MKALGIGIPLSLILCACTLGPAYERSDVGLEESYIEQSVAGEPFAASAWEQVLKDPVLRDLVKSALAENKDLGLALARISEARAILGFTWAEQLPLIEGAGNALRSDLSEAQVGSVTSPRNNFGLFALLSWELDVWGKLRSATDAQRAQVLSTEYGAAAIRSALVSEVAAGYFRLLSLDRQLMISRETYNNRKNATGIINARFSKGVVPELDVNQAQIEQATAAITAASIERSIRQTENAVSVLLGRAPHRIPRGLTLEQQLTVANVPVGFPAMLLERRPDVRAAEERVKSAVSLIGVAEANRLPSFNLFGTIGLQSAATGDFFSRDAFMWRFGGDFLGPLLDFGRTRSDVEAAKARAQQAYRSYEQTVLLSVQEVEDSVVAIRTYKEEYEQRLLQVKAASNATRLSRARYDEGQTSYLEVLDIERSLFDSQLGVLSTQELYNISVVRLYKALGGGWDPAIAPPQL